MAASIGIAYLAGKCIACYRRRLLQFAMHSGERLGQAIREAMAAKGVKQKAVADEFGVRQPSVSDWIKFGRIDKRHLRHLLDYFADVVGPDHWGLDKSAVWMPPHHPSEGVAFHTEDHDLSRPQPDHEPHQYTWEFMMSAEPAALPKRFRLTMPDDAMAPDTPRGTVLVFSTTVAPAFGNGVLVQDQAGQRHVRRYAQGPAGRWKAEARNTAYLTLDSAEGLQVLAVVVGRETSEI